ncbi:MAG: PA14 domain-containing protein [Phycisphaeraceae bacterium]
MIGQGLHNGDNELIEMLHNTLPQDLTEAQIVQLRHAMRSSAVVREALLEELRLETGLAARLAPEHMAAQEFIDRIQRLAFDRGRLRWFWRWMILLLVAGLVVGGVAVAWNLSTEKPADPLAINPAGKGGSIDPEKDPSKKTGVAVVNKGIGDPKNPGNTLGTGGKPAVDPNAPPPLPPLSPPWKLYDDATARGSYNWTSNIEAFIRPLGGTQLVYNANERDYRLRGQYAVYPPSEEGRVIRLRVTDPSRLKFTLWGKSQGVLLDLANDRVFRGHTLQRAPAKATPHGFPAYIDAKFLRRNVIDRVDRDINFNWGAGSPGSGIDAEQFAVRWTGTIETPREGRYEFIATSDDGVVLYIDGKPILNDWVSRAATESRASIDLAKGTHDIVVEYFENNSEAQMKLEWQGPQLDRQVVPTSALRTGREANAKPGLAAKYCWGPEIDSHEPDKIQLAGDDSGKWHLMREGTIDLRYQKGQVLLCRGGIVLLAVPMSEAPVEMTMESEGRLWLAEHLRLAPLPEAAFVSTPAQVQTQMAADMAWQVTPADRAKLVTISPQEDRSMLFARPDEKSNIDFRFESPIDLPQGGQVTVEVIESTKDMFIQFQIPGEPGGLQIGIGEYNGHRVICWDPSNKGDLEQRYKQGYTIPEHFFVRGEYSLGRLTVLISADGQSWRRFEAREYDPSRVPTREVNLSVFGSYREGERRIRVGRVEVRRFNALIALADEALVKRVPAIKDDEKTREFWFDDWHASLATSKPKNVSEMAWRAACNLAMVQSQLRCRLRQEAALDLVRSAAGAGVATDTLLTALKELPQQVSVDANDQNPHSYAAFIRLYDDLTQQFWNSGNRDDLKKLLDTWYAQEFGWELRWYNPKHTAPSNLVRLLQFHLWDTRRWEELRTTAMRFEFIAHAGTAWNNAAADDYPLRLVSAWMQAKASEHLQDGPTPGEGTRYNDRVMPTRFPEHPLAIISDRESMNTVSEFLAAVDSKEYPHACVILTRQSLPDGIAPVDKDNLLFKNTYVLLEQMIDANEPIAARIKEQYAAIGMIRLRQAIGQGRFDHLKSLAVQFHGTQAARDALLQLADRDLSMGNFFSAAARYDALMDQADASLKPHMIAKRRLAMAMAGVDTGEPVKYRVQLGGQTLPAGDFEQLVSSLLQERQSPGSIYADGRVVRVDAPAPKPLKLSPLVDLTPARDMQDRYGHRIRDVKFTVDGKTLFMHQHGKLTAIDLGNRQQRWQKNESARDLSSYIAEPSTPLVLGDRVYVSLFRERKIELTCFKVDNGEMVWRQAFDDAMAGDLIAIGPWLYVISVQRQLGDYADVILRRLSPETGESVLAEKVVRVRWGEELFRVGRPIVMGDTLIFRTGASLVCCDLLGAPRWIRRLSLVPASVDGPLFDFQTLSPPIISGENVIVTCPGSPHVICVNARTGEEVWSHLQPRLRKLVGPRGDKVIISTLKNLEALDMATGKLVWQVPITADYAAVLPAEKNTIFVLTLDKVENKRKSGDRRIRMAEWISATDGRVIQSQEITDEAESIHTAETLVTDGNLIIGISNILTRGKGSGKVFLLEGK